MKNDHYPPNNHNKNLLPLPNPLNYAIRIKERLDLHWDWLRNLIVTHLEQGLLDRIRDLNLTLLAVNQIDPVDQRKDK